MWLIAYFFKTKHCSKYNTVLLVYVHVLTDLIFFCRLVHSNEDGTVKMVMQDDQEVPLTTPFPSDTTFVGNEKWSSTVTVKLSLGTVLRLTSGTNWLYANSAQKRWNRTTTKPRRCQYKKRIDRGGRIH